MIQNEFSLKQFSLSPTCRLAILRSSLDEAGLSLHASSDLDPAITPSSSFVGQQHEFSHIVSDHLSTLVHDEMPSR